MPPSSPPTPPSTTTSLAAPTTTTMPSQSQQYLDSAEISSASTSSHSSLMDYHHLGHHQQQQKQFSPPMPSSFQDSPTLDLGEVLHRINSMKAPHNAASSHGTAADEIETVPSGPRHPGQGCEEMDQSIMLAEFSRMGGARLRITLLAAGFIIGPSGSSINAISNLTGADIRSRTLPADQRCPRDTREFSVEGKPSAVVHALSIMCDAVDKYKSLTEGGYAGKIVSHVQHVSGIDFFYQPPPRSKMPQAASLKGNAKKHLLAKEQKLRAQQRPGPAGLPPRVPSSDTFKKQSPTQYHLGFNSLNNHHALSPLSGPNLAHLDLLNYQINNTSTTSGSGSVSLSGFTDLTGYISSTESFSNLSETNGIAGIDTHTSRMPSQLHRASPGLSNAATTPISSASVHMKTAYKLYGTVQSSSPSTPPPLPCPGIKVTSMHRTFSCPVDAMSSSDDVPGSSPALLGAEEMHASSAKEAPNKHGGGDAVHAAICAPASRHAMHALRSASDGISLTAVSQSHSSAAASDGMDAMNGGSNGGPLSRHGGQDKHMTNNYMHGMSYETQNAQNRYNNSLAHTAAGARSLDASLLSYTQAQHVQNDAQEQLLAQPTQQLNTTMMFPNAQALPVMGNAEMVPSHDMHAQLSAFALVPARVTFNDEWTCNDGKNKERRPTHRQEQQYAASSLSSTAVRTSSVPMTPAPSLAQDNNVSLLLQQQQQHYHGPTASSLSDALVMNAATMDRAFSDQTFYSAFSDAMQSMHSMHLDPQNDRVSEQAHAHQMQESQVSNAWLLKRGESFQSASSWDMSRALHAENIQSTESGQGRHAANVQLPKNIWSFEG